MRYRESGSLDTSGVQDRRGRGRRAGRRPRHRRRRRRARRSSGSIVVVLIQVLGGGGGDVGLGARRARPASGRASRPTTAQLEQRLPDRRPTRTTRSSAPSSPTSSRSRTSGRRRSATATCPTDTVFFSGAGADQLRRRVERLRALLLPGRPARLHRPELLRPAPAAVRRPGRAVRQRLRHRPRVRPPRAEPARHQRAGDARRDRARPAARSGWNCRPTATPAPGPTTPRRCPTTRGQPLIAEITQDDIDRALDAAARIGDDFIQREPRQRAGRPGRLHPRLLRAASEVVPTGYETGDPAQCDTFATDDLG